jgi:hypothetical protein
MLATAGPIACNASAQSLWKASIRASRGGCAWPRRSGRSIATIGAQEIERNRSIASHPATVATAVAVDPDSWKLIRVQVSENEPNGTASGASYKILYLAKPPLETRPNA